MTNNRYIHPIKLKGLEGTSKADSAEVDDDEVDDQRGRIIQDSTRFHRIPQDSTRMMNVSIACASCSCLSKRMILAAASFSLLASSF